MSRTRRSTPVGTLQHFIARFIDGRYFLDLPDAREVYLERLSAALRWHDCDAVAFSLMSTHVHLAAVAGEQPFGALFESVHTSFAGWVNRTVGRIGHVFAGRFKSVTMHVRFAGVLIPYIHNNDVRANVVPSASESRWSSHRYYLGIEEPPSWLNVELGLELCGFDTSPRGRAAFHESVESRGPTPRMPALVGEGSAEERAALLEKLPGGSELLSPELEDTTSLSWRTRVAPSAPPAPWDGDPLDAIAVASTISGVSPKHLRQRHGPREVARTRAALVLAWRDCLGRQQGELSRVLGVSASTATTAYARAREVPELAELAKKIASVCRHGTLDP